MYSEAIDRIIEKEKNEPTFMGHHINSYLTNLPVAQDNKELRAILKYFPTYKTYLPLYQDVEFRHGLSVEVRGEMIDRNDLDHGITYRESIYHNHDFFEMMYVYRGTCVNYINDQPMQLAAGDLLLYNLQTVHKLILNDTEGVVFNILAGKEVFTGSMIGMFSSDDPVFQFYAHSLYRIPDDEYMIFKLADEPKTAAVIHDLIIEFAEKKEMFANILLMDFQQLLIRLARMREKRQRDLSSLISEQADINDILRYIHDHCEQISLQDLAEHYGYTTRSMMRYLKKYTHRTFSDILRENRMLAACNALKNTNTAIEEIALKTGYTERSYFDKVFKQEFSITPSEYRRQFAEKNTLAGTVLH